MSWKHRSLSVLFASSMVWGLGCSAGLDDPSAGESTGAPANASPGLQAMIKAGTGAQGAPVVPDVASTSSEYKFPASIDAEVLPDVATELWARVYRPTTLLSGVRYPVLVFLHGNHATCGHSSNPRIDDNCQYTVDGTCPAGYVVTPNHQGYAYVANQMASAGYIVVSINANRGITCGGGASSDPYLIQARANLVLRHLEMLSQWDRGISPTPSSLGVDLRNHLDFNQVGLMGHSRGGEGVRLAHQSYVAPGSPWPARIVTPVRFAGVFEVGPVDGQASPPADMQGTRWAVILPMCDGDVSDLEGVHPYDRVMSVLDETPPGFKSTFTVWGANHNYFNSEWQQSDSFGCLDHTPLFSSGPGISGSASQREVGRIAMSSFFMANIGAQRDPSLNALFDPVHALPSTLTSITRVDRGFTLSPDQDITLRLEDFVNATGTSTYGQPNLASGIVIDHTTIVEHDSALRAGSITWDAGGANTYFQTNFTRSGLGLSLLAYESLDLRVDRAFDTTRNPSGNPTDFTVQLVSAQNVLSAPQRIASYLSLVGPVGGPGGYHSMLQTARIPLGSFAPTTLNAVRGVRLTFDRTGSGAIYLANMRATRTTCAATPKLDLKIRQVLRHANEIQFRFQVFNRDSAPVRLADLSVKAWIADSTSNLVAQVYYGGGVYNGTGAYQFGSVSTSSQTTRIQPQCMPAPNRAADWAASVSGTDSRSVPANGGVWTDAEFSIHRGDWTNFVSLADDYSQTPAYQHGSVSDATWPTVYGDDTYFVLYYRGTPVAEYVASSTLDPTPGSEPSCLASCIGSVTSGLSPSFVAGALSVDEIASASGSAAPLAAAPPTLVAQATVVRLASTTRDAIPGGVDLEVASDSEFPIGDAETVLRAGQVDVVLTSRPDPSDMRRLTFTFTPEQFAQLKGGEALGIRFGQTRRWDLGTLDLAKLAK